MKHHYQDVPVGTTVKNKNGIFRKLRDSHKGAGRGEVIEHFAKLVPPGTVVVFNSRTLVEIMSLRDQVIRRLAAFPLGGTYVKECEHQDGENFWLAFENLDEVLQDFARWMEGRNA